MADFEIENIGNWICFARKMGGNDAFGFFCLKLKLKCFLWKEIYHDKSSFLQKKKIVSGII